MLADILSKSSQSVLNQAQHYADLRQERLGSIHILKALFEIKSTIAFDVLHQSGHHTVTLLGAINHQEELLTDLFETAAAVAAQYDFTHIEPEHLLFAVTKKTSSPAFLWLIHHKIDIKDIQSKIVEWMYGISIIRSVTNQNQLIEDGDLNEIRSAETKKANPKTSIIATCTKDLTAQAKQHQLDTIVEREQELTNLMQTLLRRSKNNAVLIGEPGVGKTALVHGLANRIAEGSVPTYLKDKTILELSVTTLIAGTVYRGQFEERVKQLLQEINQRRNCILFIDEIHTMVGTGSTEGSLDLANMLKPALTSGSISVIGATTVEEYQKHFESDRALVRRFQPLQVLEPDTSPTLKIVKAQKRRLEQHHQIKIPAALCQEVIELTNRYLPDRFQPDKSIDLLDEAGASLQSSGQHRQLTGADIRKVLSHITKIPVVNLRLDEVVSTEKLKENLQKNVLGQEPAIEAIANALSRYHFGATKEHQPIGSFVFVGPTGVGKTELARTIAQTTFGSNRALIKFDMSEFGASHTISQLIGSPKGYIGYDEGGSLTGRIRRQPYSVVLFDEIEKAHPDIFNILLQILEDGVLTDNHGRPAYFNHAIIIMTSNLGADVWSKPALGFDQAIATSQARATKSVTEFFRPELLGRLSEIIVFQPLSKETVNRLIKRRVTALNRQLAKRGIKIKTNATVYHWLSGYYDPQKGARSVDELVNRHYFDIIVRFLGQHKNKDTLQISSQHDKVLIKTF